MHEMKKKVKTRKEKKLEIILAPLTSVLFQKVLFAITKA